MSNQILHKIRRFDTRNLALYFVGAIVFGVVLYAVYLLFLKQFFEKSPGGGSVVPSGGDIVNQPPNTVQVVNLTSEDVFHLYLPYANFTPLKTGGISLNPPKQPWKIISGSGSISAPTSFYPVDSPPAGATPPIYPQNDAGAGTWQILTLTKGETALLGIPDFTQGQAWTVRPLKYINGQPCNNTAPSCGMPILLEIGKELVGDMSAVDGVNFLCQLEETVENGLITKINFNTNPCRAIGANPTGCRNPYPDGLFKSNVPDCQPGNGNCWQSDPCHAGTCNLTGSSKTWCDAIHTGQCSNSSHTWKPDGVGDHNCALKNQYTTYCYSHDDENSSPRFSGDYKIKLTYRDLV